MALVEVKNLSFSYGAGLPKVVKEVSFTIEPGTVTGIVGESGAGKSTLALILSGIIPRAIPGEFQGSVRLGGQELSQIPARDLARRVALVLQNPFNQMTGIATTVFDEIAFGPQNLAWPEERIRAKVDEALTRLKITHLRDRNPLELSGGEQQRVAIASILVMEPELVVLDEPTSQLDPAGTTHVFDIVTALKARRSTLVVIEHKVERLAEVCDRVLLMSGGQVVDDGSPAKVLGRADIRSLGVRRLFYAPVADALRRAGHPLGELGTYSETLDALKEATRHASH